MTVTPTVKPRYDDSDLPGDYGDTRGGGRREGEGEQGLAHGGIVKPLYAQEGAVAFKPRGTDVVPAMLTPGEGILTTAAMARLGASGLSTLNAGTGIVVQDMNRVAIATEATATAVRGGAKSSDVAATTSAVTASTSAVTSAVSGSTGTTAATGATTTAKTLRPLSNSLRASAPTSRKR